LLPACVDDYVGTDNPVRAIDAFVDSLDLAMPGFSSAQGRPARLCATGAAQAVLVQLFEPHPQQLHDRARDLAQSGFDQSRRTSQRILGEVRRRFFNDFILPLQAYQPCAPSAQRHCLWRDHPASRVHKLACSGCLDPVAHCLVTDPQLPPYRRDCLIILCPLNSQFPELGRECLLRYLPHVPSSNSGEISTSPLEDEISGEAHPMAKICMGSIGERRGRALQHASRAPLAWVILYA
jgi:hypothetical protein